MNARVLVLMFVLLLGAAAPVAPENPNGLALIYSEFPAQDPQLRPEWTLDANVTLPQRANKDWYADWIMLVGYAPDGSGPNFVQVGLIRNPKAGNELHAFFATQQWPAAASHAAQRPPLMYQDLGRVSDAPHLLSVSEAGYGMYVGIDRNGRKLPQAIPIANPFAQIGAETRAAGDAFAGSIVLLHLWSNGDAISLAPSQTLPPCIVSQFGGIVSALPSGELQFSGTVDPNQSLTMSPSCADILHNRNRLPAHDRAPVGRDV